MTFGSLTPSEGAAIAFRLIAAFEDGDPLAKEVVCADASLDWQTVAYCLVGICTAHMQLPPVEDVADTARGGVARAVAAGRGLWPVGE